MKRRKTIGLIINPVAGMGGSVGLKGTDGKSIRRKAISLGAVSRAGDRTLQALMTLKDMVDQISVITCPGEMGENVVRKLGFDHLIVQVPNPACPVTENTLFAAAYMKKAGVDLLVFSGGDGTARDIYSVIGKEIPALGIPAGVKIQSGVFATHPAAAGALLRNFLQGEVKSFVEAEVVDLDEELYRKEILTAKLYGYMRIPFIRSFLQTKKAGTQAGEIYFQRAIAADLVEKLDTAADYLIGPGSTLRPFCEQLGIEGTLLGIDLIRNGQLAGADLGEKEILNHLQGPKISLIITPTGGQGFLLGRGNQQLSARVLNLIGKENIIVAATPGKIHGLAGKPLLIDTGDPVLDRKLSGCYQVITGYHQACMYKASGFSEEP